MPQMKVNGVTIGYDVRGSGPPIVLAHGFACNKDVWWQVLPELSKRHQVITVSHRGHKGSTEPADGDYSVQAMADDLHALLKGLRVQAPVILGHSLGGFVGQVYYLSYPQACRALVLYGTLCDATRVPSSRPWGPQAADLIQREGLNAYLKDLLEHWLSSGTGPDVRERLRQECLTTPDRVAAAVTSQITTFNTCQRLPEIRVPTLLVVGSDDPRTPPSESERMNRLIPDSWLKIIKGARHCAHVDRPEEFTSALLAFLRAID